ncbi:leucine-rich repeat-containing protein 56 [Parambassis ranga]|uniref:Leucine-rich repeat-containing protein 56 n=1 Tax=Parambassis ranga TaxID=210632 RepID=A0A6P7ITX4_9TELE|nr:leucine-rich repeat-containing protein 56 [Parambassis ranga]
MDCSETEMSCCHGSVPQEVRPGTARVLVTELSGSSNINPTPATKPCEDSDTTVELYLSQEKLKLLCGTPDLSHVTSLEVCIDTQENTLANFGAYLPRLVQLKMNNSVIMSVRDLGTAFSHLQVLWISHCCLQDLDGISTFSCLKELYVAYNNVSDLSQVGMLENLLLLDLEGNNVDNLVQVQYLGLCSKLQRLTLEGNPVCLRPNPTSTQIAEYSYRAAVRELVPQLRYLDDVKVEEDKLSCCITFDDHWDMLQACTVSQADLEDADSASSCSRPSIARRPASSLFCVRPLLSADSRPNTGLRPMSATRVLSPPESRPGSAESDLAVVESETSALTHGAGKILFCGNPVQAIRARREKLRTAPSKSTFNPCERPIHVPEHPYDLEEPDLGDRVDVFAELRAWREQHSKHLEAIERERLPQVLTIQHSDEEDVDEEEEEGFGIMRSGGSDDDNEEEEHKEEKQCDSIDTSSPDSCFHSLSPDMHHREALARLSLSPDTTLSPLPPPSATAAAGSRKLSGIRRLRLSQANSKQSPRRASASTSTSTSAAERALQRDQQTRINVHQLPKSIHIPRPPPRNLLGEELLDSGVEMDLPNIQPCHKHEMSKLPTRSVITRPHTALAALQKHHQTGCELPLQGRSVWCTNRV